MSVYKPNGSPFYHYDFQWRGARFHGSTKRTDRREAQAVEKSERERVKRTGSPWARRRRIKLADLINEPWALPPPDNLAHGWATDAFRAAGLEPPRPAMITTTGVARIALVAKGRFLTIASETVLRFGGWESAIRVLPIDLATKSGAVGIITLKNRTLTPVAKLFMDCAREVAKPMAMPRRRQPQKARI